MARTPVGQTHKLTVMAEQKHEGEWVLPEHSVHNVGMGEVRLDLRQAHLSAHTSTIEARAIMGSVKVIVPASYRVECDGSQIMADFKLKEDGDLGPAPTDAPLIKVTGYALMGEVIVIRTAAAPGLGSYAVDGVKGKRNQRRLERQRRQQERRLGR